MTFLKSMPKIAAALGVALMLAGCGVNNIPTKDQAVKARLADVQASYQRRADLIPNLVNTVQGYARQEQSVLVAVTQARASATQVKLDASTITDPQAFARFQQAQDQLSGVLGRLMAISEQYPDLKSNQNFLALQSQLEGTENRIEIARRDYNAAVQDYNTELVTLPGSLWAATVYRSYKQATPFAASAAAQTAPTVNFDNVGVPPAPPVPAPAAPARP
ncbi:MAG: LemA family protein [Alphaproteobacteria bacterium 65-7]|nr:MAG: LemA family protein [Alphaproteobacteria bacterium 65-7]